MVFRLSFLFVLFVGVVPSAAQVDGTLELGYAGDFRFGSFAWIFPIQAWVAKLVWEKNYTDLLPVPLADKRDFNISLDILDTIENQARTVEWAQGLMRPCAGTREPVNALICCHISASTKAIASLGTTFKTVQISDLSGDPDLSRRAFYQYMFRTLHGGELCNADLEIVKNFTIRRMTFFYSDNVLGQSHFERYERCVKEAYGDELEFRGQPLQGLPSERDFNDRKSFLDQVEAIKLLWSSRIDLSMATLNSRIFVLFLSTGYSVFFPLIIEKGLVGPGHFWRVVTSDIFVHREGTLGLPNSPADWTCDPTLPNDPLCDYETNGGYPPFWHPDVIGQFAGGMLERTDVRDPTNYPKFVKFWNEELTPSDFPDQMHCYLYGGCEKDGACNRTIRNATDCTALDGIFYDGGLAATYSGIGFIEPYPNYTDIDIFQGRPPPYPWPGGMGIPEPDPVAGGESSRAFDAMMALLVATNTLLNNGTNITDVRGDLLKAMLESQAPVVGIGGNVSFDPSTGNRNDSIPKTSYFRIDESGAPTQPEAAAYEWYLQKMTWYGPWRFADNAMEILSLPPECPAGQYADSDWMCRQCPAGHFQPQAGQEECIPCLLGTYNGDTGQPSCTPCARGMYADTNGSLSCTPCPPGNSTDQLGSEICDPCAKGNYAPDNGTELCLNCPKGTYQNDTGQTQCIECPSTKSTPDVGARTIEDCTCVEGTFLDIKHDMCKGCDGNKYTGLRCVGVLYDEEADRLYDLPLLEKNYWAALVKDKASFEDIDVFRCLEPYACLGGSPDPALQKELPLCDEGREGRACSICQRGYYKRAGSCNKCGSGTSSLGPFVITLILLYILAIVFHIFVNTPQSRKIAVTLNISLTLGMLINFMQNLSIVGTFNIDYPQFMRDIFSFAGIFLFDVEFIRLACVIGRTPLASYITRQLVPIVIIFIFFSLWGICAMLKSLRIIPGPIIPAPQERSRRSSLTRVMYRVAHGKDVSRRRHSSLAADNDEAIEDLPDEALPEIVPRDNDSDEGAGEGQAMADPRMVEIFRPSPENASPTMKERTRGMVRDVHAEDKEEEAKPRFFMVQRNPLVRCIERITSSDLTDFDKFCNSLGMAVQILYISFVNNACAAFQCYEHGSKKRTLFAYPEILCDSNEWRTQFLPVGILVMLFYVFGVYALFAYVSIVAPWYYENKSFKERFRFLFFRFRPDVYWWGAILLARNGLLATVTAMSPNDGHLQALITIFIIIVSLSLQIFYWPWLSNENNFLDVSLLLALCVMCVSGQYFIPRTDRNESVFIGTLLGTVFISFALVIVSIVLPIVMASNKRLKKMQKMQLKRLTLDSKIVGYCLYHTPSEFLEMDLETVTAPDKRKLRQTVEMLKLEAIDKPLYVKGLHKVLGREGSDLIPDDLYAGDVFQVNMATSGRLTRAHMRGPDKKPGAGVLMGLLSRMSSIIKTGKSPMASGRYEPGLEGRDARPSEVHFKSVENSPTASPKRPQEQQSGTAAMALALEGIEVRSPTEAAGEQGDNHNAEEPEEVPAGERSPTSPMWFAAVRMDSGDIDFEDADDTGEDDEDEGLRQNVHILTTSR